MSKNEVFESSDDDMEDEESFRHYYDHDAEESDPIPLSGDDVERFEYELLRVEDVERLLNETVEALCKAINVCIQLQPNLKGHLILCIVF